MLSSNHNEGGREGEREGERVSFEGVLKGREEERERGLGFSI